MSESSPAEILFFTALEMATPSARDAYLDKACGADRDLRQSVEEMLAAHGEMGSFMEHGPLAGDGDSSVNPLGTGSRPSLPRPSAAGSLIAGRYQLLEPIGEGGMGLVWSARQVEPIKRLVAVKLVKAGWDCEGVLARFNSERQALALMDHPHIAKVFDAGETAEGCPYFVMELVEGMAITRYCDERKLSLPERLHLFICVCQAIQHAHQKGVIHRDIKPSNVLVAHTDGRPVPKVIDFGVVKASGKALTGLTLQTGFGAVVGTPEYMSPEQAEFNQRDIDTRSDIYALGVLLYELLTGSTPVSRQDLEKAGVLEVLRIIREQEPPRPSTRLSGLATLAEIASARGSEPKILAGLLKSDLDWIVMKALEKERDRRYPTANGLAADIQRYLDGQTVAAHPPSTAYRLRKYARKNRLALATATSFLAMLVIAVLVSAWLAIDAHRAKRMAEENSQRADQNAALVLEGLKSSESARQLAETTAASIQVDLDLAEVKANPKIGVLRLAKTLRKIPDDRGEVPFVVPPGLDPGEIARTRPSDEEFRSRAGSGAIVPASDEVLARQKHLRELVTAAILTSGQEFAPLLDPIPMKEDGAIKYFEINQTGDRFLSVHSSGTACLWDTRSLVSIKRWQKNSDVVHSAKFSDDGALFATESIKGDLSIWKASDGSFLSQIVPKKNDAPLPGNKEKSRSYVSSSFSRDRLITCFIVSEEVKVEPQAHPAPRVLEGEPYPEGFFGYGSSSRKLWKSVTRFEGPRELWDARTGKFIATIEKSLGNLDLTSAGKWIVASDRPSSIVVLSPEDGKVRKQIDLPADVTTNQFYVSPTGRWLAVKYSTKASPDPRVQIWDCETWQQLPQSNANWVPFEFFTDDLLQTEVKNQFKLVRLAKGSEPKYVETDEWRFTRGNPARISGDLILGKDGQIFDWRKDRILLPLPGRKYPSEIQRFARDGRFIFMGDAQNGGSQFIDSITEKSFPARKLLLSRPDYPMTFQPDFGWISFDWGYSSMPDSQPRIAPAFRLPPGDRLAFPPALVELWIQVALRGELNPDGIFRQWDEATWEQKRQELEAMPIPDPQFPFPGFVVKDGLHWLRTEFQNAPEPDKPSLAKQLLDRCNAHGNQSEAIQWTQWLSAHAKKLERSKGNP